MEAAPPTYETATEPQKWDLIARYLSSNDLCSAALVCEEWHTIFAPHLWGNPASHFGTENDRVYVALTKFKRTLPWARLSVRSLTHTLHLPPAHAEIYYGPHTDWLREVLLRLPNLQSLIVRGLPFFDHACLNALKYIQPTSGNRDPYAQAFGLRLLDASRCGNVTATGLCQALNRFPFMLYLDLSFTYPAKEHTVLKTLRHMTGLQVLKLRGISLRDEDMEVLAPAISTRVRALDVRNNQLTDRSVRTLLTHCFSPQTSYDTSTFSSYNDRSPSLLQYLGAEMLAIYRGEQYEGYLRKAFTTGFVNQLAIEDTPESGTGITHLSISDNNITVEGASGLLRSKRLHVLDIGAVKPDLTDHPSFRHEEDISCMTLPGAEKLVHVLVESAGQTLTFLRIDHRLITQDTSTGDELEIVPGHAELPDASMQPSSPSLPQMPQEPVEIPDNGIFELPAEPVRVELQGDSVHFKVTPASDEQETDVNPPTARRGSDTAPEVVTTPQDEFNMLKMRRGSEVAPETVTPPDLPPGYSLEPLSAFEELSISRSPVSPIAHNNNTTPPSVPLRNGRARTYSSVVSERMTRVKTHLAQSKFHPGILPCLTTLILTEVPPFSTDSSTPDRLIDFIHDCAEEAQLAQLQAQLDYSAPPGRKHSHTVLDSRANNIFALQEIALEIARDISPTSTGQASAWRHHSTKSVTQDFDSEALASAADTDFSFFGEYDDDMPSLEPSQSVPFPAMSGLEVGTAPPPEQPALQPVEDTLPRVDVIARISEFRKAKKAAYQAQMAHGIAEPHVEGQWKGNVKVIRPSHNLNPMEEDGEIVSDYYGNIYTNGGIYR